MAMRKDPMTRVAVLVCGLSGAILWLASPYITGWREPWDAAVPVYPLILFILGFIGAALVPYRVWLTALALLAGQMVGLLWCVFHSSRVGGLWPMGLVIILPLYLLVSLFGALFGAPVGMSVREAIYRRRRTEPSGGENADSPRH